MLHQPRLAATPLHDAVPEDIAAVGPGNTDLFPVVQRMPGDVTDSLLGSFCISVPGYSEPVGYLTCQCQAVSGITIVVKVLWQTQALPGELQILSPAALGQ